MPLNLGGETASTAGINLPHAVAWSAEGSAVLVETNYRLDRRTLEITATMPAVPGATFTHEVSSEELHGSKESARQALAAGFDLAVSGLLGLIEQHLGAARDASLAHCLQQFNG